MYIICCNRRGQQMNCIIKFVTLFCTKMRKHFLLLFGILGVILFSRTGFIQQQQQSLKAKTVVDCTSYFESGAADYMWSLEKSETTSIVSNDNQLSHQKKRGLDSFCRFFRHSEWFSLPVTFLFQKPESRTNLFLIYHYSLSLWQVFLQ